MKIEMFFAVVLVGGLFVAKAGTASAGISEKLPIAAPSAKGVCQDDVSTFCKDIKPGGISVCLQDNLDKLSDGCKAQIIQRIPCRVEQDKVCPGLTGGKLAKCMKANKDKFSANCKTGGGFRAGTYRQFIKICIPDAKRLCKAVIPGDPLMLPCLRAHQSELSAACKAVIPQEELR